LIRDHDTLTEQPNSLLFPESPHHVPWVGFFLVLLCLCCSTGHSALLDAWRAADLNMVDDDDSVGAWTSQGGRILTAKAADTPRLKKDATPTGEAVVTFELDQMSTRNSPVAGASEFSLVVVFKVTIQPPMDTSRWYRVRSS
jgi:hypothetical protein